MRCSIDESHCAFECGRFQRAPLHHQPDTSRGLARHHWRPSTTAHALPADQHFGGGCDFLGNQRAYFSILGLFGSANRTVRTRKHEVRPCNVVVDPPPHTFEDRIAAEKALLEAQVAKLVPGTRKDMLLEKISQLQNASYMNKWLRSPGLRPPD